MNVLNPILGGSIALLAAFAVIPAAYAAYPKTMKVSVEVWNDKEQDIHMTYASWEPKGASLSSYFIPAQNSGRAIDVTLDNPRNDAAVFRYANTEGQKCEFRMSHKVVFRWIGVNPAPEKTATAKSIGTVPAECSAAVTKSTDSMSSYTVKFSMK